jgi:hypothetical protein
MKTRTLQGIAQEEALKLPTLTASSATRGAAKRGQNAQGGPSLQEAILMPTLTARDEKGPGPAHTKAGSDLPQWVGGHLSPTFCEWFMGFPLGWTEPVIGSPRSATRARRSKRKSPATSSESSSKRKG